jgi:medium-chain acyl-[acyl-carrier-protein] hydrolase
MLALRDCEILVGSRKIGECTASWLTFDTVARRLVKPASDDTDVTTRVDYTLALNPGSIAVGEGPRPIMNFQVHNSDLNVNGHVLAVGLAGQTLLRHDKPH